MREVYEKQSLPGSLGKESARCTQETRQLRSEDPLSRVWQTHLYSA